MKRYFIMPEIYKLSKKKEADKNFQKIFLTTPFEKSIF